MTTQTNSFRLAVRTALSATPIGDLLSAKTGVVLERIAMGGGATNWYYCPNKSSLEILECKFSPGSLVSFYFDERIRSDIYSPGVKRAVYGIIAQNGEAVVGALAEDGLQIGVEIVAGPNDFADFLSAITPESRVFYGAFPADDNDGVQAVTLTLPDADGTVRAHPY